LIALVAILIAFFDDQLTAPGVRTLVHLRAAVAASTAFGRSFANSLTDERGRFPSRHERCRLSQQSLPSRE
jgi:hypothetical protein